MSQNIYLQTDCGMPTNVYILPRDSAELVRDHCDGHASIEQSENGYFRVKIQQNCTKCNETVEVAA